MHEKIDPHRGIHIVETYKGLNFQILLLLLSIFLLLLWRSLFIINNNNNNNKKELFQYKTHIIIYVLRIILFLVGVC
jgi:hypothetical protein